MRSLSSQKLPTHLAHLEALGHTALMAYPMRVEPLTLLRNTNNAVFKVETGTAETDPAYVLRIHRPGYRTITETQSELRYLLALRGATGLHVPEPVATSDGAVVTSVAEDGRDEPRHCDMLTWIDGRVLRPGHGLGPRGAYLLGEVLGRTHEHAEHFEPPAEFDLPRWDADGLFASASPYKPGPLNTLFSPEDRAMFEEVERQVRDAFQHLGQGPAEYGTIHADFILGNCLFLHRTAHVLDWDDCGWGYFLYDMCTLLGNLKDYPGHLSLQRAFLDGYRSARTLPDEHERLINLLIAVRHATSCLWVAGSQRMGGTGPNAAEHIAYRMQEVRQYFAE